MLSDREVASLIWLALIGAYVARNPGVRESFAAVIRAFFAWQIATMFALFITWIALIVYAMSRVGLWEPSMFKDTLLWGIAGAALVGNSVTAVKEPGFFRRRLIEAVGLAAFAEFYLNFGNLGLIPELIVQPVLTFAIIVPILLPANKENNLTLRVVGAVRVLLVIVLLIPPAAHLIGDRASLDWAEIGRDYALPIWLTLWTLPFGYLFGVVSGYEQLFVHMRLANNYRGAPMKVKVAALATFRLRIRDINSFAGDWARRLVKAGGFRAARKVIEDYRIDQRTRAEVAKKEADDLVRYAGVKGTDNLGRQLDRREFEATTDALEWLHTMQMGWFNRDGRYRDDLADAFPDTWSRRGLPKDHGIKVSVSRSGKSWIGWRTTTSGWVFGIGSRGPTPDEWYYDGSEPPAAFPGPDRGGGWAAEPFTFTLNWPDYELNDETVGPPP